MYRVTKKIRFCYGHRLLHHEGKCRHLHGHNGRAEIELSSGQLDGRGMVVDFEEIKKAVKRWIDTTLDHTLLLNEADPLLPALRAAKERYYAMPGNPTAEVIAKLIFDHAQAQRFPVIRVTLWETDDSSATYEPSKSRFQNLVSSPEAVPSRGRATKAYPEGRYVEERQRRRRPASGLAAETKVLKPALK